MPSYLDGAVIWLKPLDYPFEQWEIDMAKAELLPYNESIDEDDIKDVIYGMRVEKIIARILREVPEVLAIEDFDVRV